MAYAFTHLGQGVPLNLSNPFYLKNIQNLRAAILSELIDAVWGQAPTTRVSTTQLDDFERRWAEHLLQEESLRRLSTAITHEDEQSLRTRLNDPRRAVQLVALRTISGRRLHLEDALIARLEDRSPTVSQASRRALVRLARGTDFGPPPRAAKAARAKAIARWQHWLALQRLASGTDSRSAAVDFQTAVDGVLGRTTHTLAAVNPEIIRLRDELIRADGDAHEEVLARLRDAKGVVHTEAIVQAIPQLPDPMQAKARAALVERLTRMTAKTLRDKFGQDEAEVRRAAALACAAKQAQELIPDLIALLDDPEPAVVRAAHASLKELTHQDFGPPSAATPAERGRALAAWNDWWDKRQAAAATEVAAKEVH
jgi:hypothetical protein